MKKSYTQNTETNKFFDRRLKTLFLIAFLIFVWILIIHFFTGFIKSGVSESWSDISREQNQQQETIAKNIFNEYQTDLVDLSNKLTTNPEIVKQVQKSDSKKLFEELLKFKVDANYQFEIFNTRLELLAFKGRKLESDVYSLQRCLSGNKFSLIKEIGFYTYLVIYSPVYSDDKSQIIGVILCAKFIDINYQINNKFFRNIGILNDIDKILQTAAEIIPANPISGRIDFDTSKMEEDIRVDLKGIDGNTIGILLLPQYSIVSHMQNIDALSTKVISLLIFGLSVIIFLILYKWIVRLENPVLKFVSFAILLTAIRYFWLEFYFPSKTIDSEIFSPGFYATSFGFGIAKSLGEFLITSIFILIISIYGLNLSSKSAKTRRQADKTGIMFYLKSVILISLFFGSMFGYIAVIQSIIHDSNLKFFDKSSIIPSPELFMIQLTILFLTFALFCFLLSAIIPIVSSYRSQFKGRTFYRVYFYVIFLLVLLVINHVLGPPLDEYRMDYVYRIIIIILSCGFGIYLAENIILSRGASIFTVKNFSIVILFCIITIPGILLEKITSQEKNFVELIGEKFTEKEDDRIKFLLMTELSAFSENKRLETDIKNKNKLSELAFSIWAESKFSEENFNTAIVVLDTNKKILSDFVFNSQVLVPDSIVSYANQNFFKKKKQMSQLTDSLSGDDTLDLSEEEETDEETDPEVAAEDNTEDLSRLYITDKIILLKNEQEKYYLGIVPLEIIGLKNTPYQTNIGYVLTAVQYESRNFLVKSSVQLFKNYSKDNLFDKLISNPIITEYVSGEIVGSNDPDLSKTNNTSLDAFRESIKNKKEKFDWRYEIINNEKYKTLYILANPAGGAENERIFSVSLKRNDFKLTTFYYLKFILFVIFIYLLVLAVITVILLFKIREFRMNFREKLFVSFFIVSVIPIVLLAVYTRGFIKDKYDQNFQNEIISDLNLVTQSIKTNRFRISNLDSLSNEQNKLFALSLNQSDKNFNLFLKTKLVSSTNEELYKSDLIDTRVDADAYYNIVYLRKDFFSKTEEIGVYSFIAGYKPFFDPMNNIVGMISSQTVYKQNEINEELTEILTFIFGIYFIVIIVLLVFVAFITDRISKPILRLQNATEKISRGENNIELKVNRKDEIGNLIESFNKMTRELESSKNKLKRAEREAAWRDIARRVAHEIKNPLTPMKLSIQHLDEVFNEGNGKNFPDVLKKTRNMIINEIDKLNRIATEFSNFAKLSGRNYEVTDVNEVIEEVLSLYRLSPSIKFVESLDPGIKKILADRHELNRAFQNLIKNSIQAIEGEGKIEVKTYGSGEYVFAEIIDTGDGIDESVMSNLFEPNFSTKSTGMGLGLAITKKTFDDMKAEITFESSTSTGTRAIIKFKAFNAGDNGILNY